MARFNRRATVISAVVALSTHIVGCSSSAPGADDHTQTLSDGDDDPQESGESEADENSDTDELTFEDDGDDEGENDDGTDSDSTKPMIDGLPCSASDPCPEGGLCTSSGVCGEIHGECQFDRDCEGDTYCCHLDCREDGSSEGVCIPHEIPPGSNECVEPPSSKIFAPDVQCAWNPGANAGDGGYVQHSPLVADLPFGPVGRPEIVFLSTSTNPSVPGFQLVIVDGEKCEEQQILGPGDLSIDPQPWSHPATGDIDGDGDIEIVLSGTAAGDGVLLVLHWTGTKYEEFWRATTEPARYKSPALHDLNDDGIAEVLLGAHVFEGLTGVQLNPTQSPIGSSFAMDYLVVSDLDGDPEIELFSTDVYEWTGNMWKLEYAAALKGRFFGYADFGTPRSSGQASDFDFSHLDGIAELVFAGADTVGIATLDGTIIVQSNQDPLNRTTGTPTIGDFDNDGQPEIATAGQVSLNLYDPGCLSDSSNCVDGFLRWAQPSQDNSSGVTGASLFDFDGDGRVEVVYADECFLRIYNGEDGNVLFSTARQSLTWLEYPVVADSDGDQNSELIVNMGSAGVSGLTFCGNDMQTVPDPIHPGQQCEVDDDCESSNCQVGLCRCSTDNECRGDQGCYPPLPGSPGAGDVCRARSPDESADDRRRGVWVFRDALDRWVSSRPLWNQVTYTVSNINDDGTIPRTSDWQANFRVPGLNNFLQNRQGTTDSSAWPEITGALEKDDACVPEGTSIRLNGHVCNRGKKAVGSKLPATFYHGLPADGAILCTSYTEKAVPVNGCLNVSCLASEDARGLITMVANDDGMGGMTALECNPDNNSDSVEIKECIVPPAR